MIRHLLIIMTLIFGLTAGASAQLRGGHGDREKMMKELREYKIKFLAQEMNLEDGQKERFVELYNEMSDKRADCMRDARNMERELKKKNGATEADYQAVTDAMAKAKARDAAIEKNYDDQFAKFLSQKQIFKMKEAENEFRKKMSEMRQKRNR